MNIIILILLAYGISNIIVQGAIFEEKCGKSNRKDCADGGRGKKAVKLIQAWHRAFDVVQPREKENGQHRHHLDDQHD